MPDLFRLAVDWLWRQPKVVMRFRGWDAENGQVVFRIQLGNDGPTIARQVTIDVYLDKELIGQAEPPADVPPNSPYTELAYVRLQRPDQADVEPGPRLTLHDRKLWALARAQNSGRTATAIFELP